MTNIGSFYEINKPWADFVYKKRKTTRNGLSFFRLKYIFYNTVEAYYLTLATIALNASG